MSREHEKAVAQDLEQQYGIPSDIGSLENHLELLAMQKASEYWEAHSGEIVGILDDSALAVYDVDALGFNFRKAVSNSTLYQLISRCLGNPDDYFGLQKRSTMSRAFLLTGWCLPAGMPLTDICLQFAA